MPCRRALLQSCYGKHLRPNLPGRGGQPYPQNCQQGFWYSLCPLQVRSVPVRKDDEVTVVRGTYKVGLHAGKQLAGSQWDCSPVTQLRDAAPPFCKQAVVSFQPLRYGWL